MSFPRIQSGMNADHTDGMQLPERHYTSTTSIAYGTVSHLSSTVFTNESTQLVAGIEEKYVDCMVGGGGGGGGPRSTVCAVPLSISPFTCLIFPNSII